MDGNANCAGERGHFNGPKSYQSDGGYGTKGHNMAERAIYNGSTGGGTPAAPVSNNLLSIIGRAEGILERIHMLASGAESAADKLGGSLPQKDGSTSGSILAPGSVGEIDGLLARMSLGLDRIETGLVRVHQSLG